MKFKNIAIKNFLAIEEASLKFAPGVHLIEGLNHDMTDEDESNGAGKSSLFEAIEWALYNHINRDGWKSDDVINRSAGEGCSVLVEFEHDDHYHQLHRTRAPNSLQLLIDGANRTRHTVRETEMVIESSVPISHSLFRYAVMVGQGMPNRFIGLTEGGKQELLSEIVGLVAYDNALSNAKTRCSEAGNSARVATSVLSERQLQIKAATEAVATAERQIQEYLGVQPASSEQVGQEIAGLDKTISDLNGQADSLREVASTCRQEAKTFDAAFWQSKTALDAKNVEYTRLSTTAAITRNSMQSLEKLGSVCPTCRSPITAENLAEHLTKEAMTLSVIEAQMEGVQAQLKLLQASSQETLSNKTSLEREADKQDAEIRRLVNQATDMQRRRDTLQVQAQKIQELRARLDERLRVAKAHLQGLEVGLEPMLKRASDEANNVRHWEWWTRTIPQMRAAALEEVLGFLNARLAVYMDIFSSGTITIKLYQEAYGQGSKIKVDLRTPGGTYGMSSGGERRRVDLALYLGLSDLLRHTSGSACNLLVCDEIVDNLSRAGVRRFLQILRTKADEGTCVYVTSHNPVVRNSFEFDSVLCVERKQGRARLRTVG